MKTNNIKLPIFPLSMFLLPEGMTRLRIFEPRYLKMVSIASKGQGFIIWPSGDKRSLSSSPWGSWVEIVNFDQGHDGVLEIDLKCKSLVEIQTIEVEDDNLHFGQVKQLNHWSQKDTDISLIELSKSLEDVFANNDSLNDLYPQKSIDNPSWVIARWLELLPINLDIKSTFVIEHNFQEAKDFVQTVINK
jgi:Lon protease-like protein